MNNNATNDKGTDMLFECSTFNLSPETDLVNNWMVNGDISKCKFENINHMVIIGDFSSNELKDVNKVVQVKVDSELAYLDNMLMRESQRGWTLLSSVLDGHEKINYRVKTSMLVMRAFSKCLVLMEGMSDEEVVTACREILRSVKEYKNNKSEEHDK